MRSISTPPPNLTYQLSLYKSKKTLGKPCCVGGNPFALKAIKEESSKIEGKAGLRYTKAYTGKGVTN